MEKQKNAVGRRKEAVTRVFITKGDGKITVNDKDYKVYFPLVYLQNQVEAPLKTIESLDKFDVKINAASGAKVRVASSRWCVPRAFTEKSVAGSLAAQSCEGCAAVWTTSATSPS